MYTPYMTRPGRPTGVAILTVLQIINGIGEIAFGTLLIFLYFVSTALLGGGFIAIALLLFGFVALALGIFSFVLAYGLWAGKGWGWGLSIVFAIIGLVFGVLSLVSSLLSGGLLVESIVDLVPIILYIIILVYLNTRNVRAFFGRAGGIAFGRQMGLAPGGPPYMPQNQPPYTQAPQQTYYRQQGAYPQSTPLATTACSYCGAPNNPSANFCDNCGNRLR